MTSIDSILSILDFHRKEKKNELLTSDSDSFMQRPIRGYRGGIRASSHRIHFHHADDNNEKNNHLSLLNSSSDEMADINDENSAIIESKNSSMLTAMAFDNDIDATIRSLRSLTTNKKKTITKGYSNMNSQKVDLPQLNMITDKTNNLNEQTKDKSSNHWYPKSDIIHVDSNDFIRHNHIDLQQTNELSPALLTTIPPVGILTRPTAIVASAGPTRSISAFFSSNSSIKKMNSNSINDFENTSLLKSISKPTTSCLIQTASSAFQPINSLQTLTSLNNQEKQKIKSQSLSIDIPKHQSLKPGERLTNVHISHPQSPSIVYLMLHEDFNKACRLLHKMMTHSELQLTFVSSYPFKPKLNQICACFHEGHWFRCRILQISSDYSTATVVYLDWGMIISMKIEPNYIRPLPNEFYTESICSILCHLVDIPDSNDTISSDIIAQCIELLSEDKYEIIVNDYDEQTGGKVVLFNNGRNINDQIKQLLLLSNNIINNPKEELTEQFRHQLQLSIGDESKALLSSFSGKDDTFYVLIINENTVAIDRAMNELQEDHIPNREYLQIPQVKSLVVARYANDGRCYRAWVKSIDIPNEQAVIFFVDFGNESKVSFSDIYICPETVRTLPWLGVRVRLIDEKMTNEELTAFWKLTESHYIWIRINEIFKDSYGVQIKIDYTVYLRHERWKMLTPKQMIDRSVQTQINQTNSSLLISSSLTDQNENILSNLFDMINSDLRSLRNRINDSNESSQDRHNQLMQLLLSIFNSNNNSTYQKKDFK